MSSAARDKWADWLLERRHGGDPEALEATLQQLRPIRDRVLDNAGVHDGDTVLDVGCGDGLIAFGALDRVGDAGRVIFSDVSNDLLEHARSLALQAGVEARCDFVTARAQDLAPIGDASVDALTTRSVFIYVPLADKPRAFEEFFRVLRSGGRLSMFEPINRFAFPEPEDRFLGFDIRPILPLARKLKAALDCRSGDQSLVDFDERDLIALAERAGFQQVELVYEASIEHGGGMAWGTGPSWDVMVNTAGNPCAPTIGESLEAALTPSEREEFIAYLRPLYEAHEGTARSAVAYLRAVKR